MTVQARPLQPLTFPLHGIRLIEASAGTGKTWTLAALYVRLILQHGGDNAFSRPLLPPHILVVTFTEAATQELRDRIRQRIESTARCFRQPDTPGDDFVQALLADYSPSQYSNCARLLEVAAQWMDDAAIFTIHSFCKRVLSQFTFLTGANTGVELSPNTLPLDLQVARDYWRSQIYPLPPVLATMAAEHWGAPDALLARIRFRLNNSDPIIDPPASLNDLLAPEQQRIDTHRQELEQTAHWVTEIRQSFERAWADKALKRSKPSNSANIVRWLNHIEEWAHGGFDGPIPYKDATARAFQGTEIHRVADNPSDESVAFLAAHPAFAVWAAEHAGARALDETTQENMDRHAAHWIGTQRQQLKQRLNTQGYDDLLRDVQRALQTPQADLLRRRLLEQYPFALVDEFQDTDPLQFDIFSRLYFPHTEQPTEHAPGFCMIGDPKQAIYAFRGADIHTYLAARQGPIDSLYALGNNFRSSPPLVAAVNRLFACGNAHARGPFLLNDRIPFSPVIAKGEHWQLMLDGTPQAAHQFWRMETDGNVSKGHYQEHFAEVTASSICQLLNLASADRAWLQHDEQRRPIKPADIAILVRTAKEAAAIREALQKRQLPSVYLSERESVFNTQEAQDMLAWLRALAEPHRESLIRNALATPTMQQDYVTLNERFHREDYWENELENFDRYHQIWNRYGILPALHRMLHDYRIPEKLQQHWNERALTNVLHLSELLQQASQEQDGPHALIHWFAKTRHQVLNNESGNDAFQLRLESDDALIRVVTIHKSKGLEYPLVFLPFICHFRAVDRKDSSISYHDDSGHRIDTFFATDEDIDRAEEERLAEDIRLLYVALTRARYHSWAGMASIGTKHESHFHRAGIGYLLTGGKPVTDENFADLLRSVEQPGVIQVLPSPAPSDERFQPPATAEKEKPSRLFQTPAPTRWYIASFSALRYQATDNRNTHDITHTHWDDVPSLEDTATPPSTIGIYDFPRGAQAGSLLHAAMEWMANTGFHQISAETLHTWIAGQPLKPEHRTVLQQWLLAILQTPLAEDNRSLDAITPQDYVPEMEFWVEVNPLALAELDQLVRRHFCPGMPRPALEAEQLNGVLKGFIDLTLQLNGRYWVVDYKSNYLGPQATYYHLPAIQEALLQKRYDVQCALYLLALHRLLKNRLANYTPQQHLGGAMLWFVRGIEHADHGLCRFTGMADFVETLDRLFQGHPLPPGNAL